MGSGSSRLGDRRPKATSFKRRISSCICGSSSSRDTAEMEDYPVELLVNSAGYSNSVPENPQALHKETALRSTEGIECTGPEFEQRCLFDSRTLSNEGLLLENAQSNIESANKEKHRIVGNESVLAYHLHKETRSSQPSTSSKCRSGAQSSTNVDCGMLVSGINDLENNGSPESSVEVLSLVRLPQQELNSLFIDRAGIEGHSGAQTRIVGSSSIVSSAVYSSNIDSRSRGDDSHQDVVPSDLGFLISDRIQGSSQGNVLHVDIMSVPSADYSGMSNELSTLEARRNSRRMVWDTFSSRNSRRHDDYPSILFVAEDVDSIGSHRSWLLDFGSTSLNDYMSDNLWHLDRRSHLAEPRSDSRSELGGRTQGGTGEIGEEIVALCPSGMHPNGPCLCGLADGVGSQNRSMLRIAMPVEALFEVLDELHQQPTPFGLSNFSNPALESTVDSLPIKSYEKPIAVESGDDTEQCYICLEEYVTGEKLRVLPCNHEYHMTCVDKWLKEIHGVCPLCRGDVAQGTKEGSLPDSVGSSMPVDQV